MDNHYNFLWKGIVLTLNPVSHETRFSLGQIGLHYITLRARRLPFLWAAHTTQATTCSHILEQWVTRSVSSHPARLACVPTGALASGGLQAQTWLRLGTWRWRFCLLGCLDIIKGPSVHLTGAMTQEEGRIVSGWALTGHWRVGKTGHPVWHFWGPAHKIRCWTVVNVSWFTPVSVGSSLFSSLSMPFSVTIVVFTGRCTQLL